MLQVLKSINEFDHLVEVAKTKNIQITLIGYLDEPYEELQPGDLILYLGTPNTILGWSKHILYKIQLFLTTELLPTRLCKNQLFVLNEVLIKSFVTISNYSSGLIKIKLVNGLNDFGIAGFEIYDLVLKATDFYLNLISEEVDQC